MDQIAALPSTAIYEILMPTFKIFAPLLQANSAAIKAIPKTTHSYGQHPRQRVDVYTPPAASTSQPAPTLIFLYGGGLVGGDCILPAAAIPDSLVYANLGAFFASHGFVTLIPDYRRVNNAQTGTGEDAVFPSGAEDLTAVLGWLASSGSGGGRSGGELQGLDAASRERPARDVFLMGNSAGGVHLATWLLAPALAAVRKSYLPPTSRGPLRLRGAVLFSVPFHFKDAHPERDYILEAYYGEAVEQHCAFGLLEILSAAAGRGDSKLTLEECGIPRVLNLEADLDADDEILGPGRDFVGLWKETFGAGGIEEWVLVGHNHISPPVALMSGDREGEKWGEDLVGWMRKEMTR